MNIYKDLEQLPNFKNTVLTIGTYDGVHIGHQAIIHRMNDLAKNIKGESVVLTFDPHPRLVLQKENKDLKLISTIEEKTELLEQFGLDNLVIIPFSTTFASMEAEDYVRNFLVKLFHPSIIVIGYDHKFGKERKGDIKLLKDLSAKFNYTVEEISVQTIDEISVSSTKVRNALSKGNIEDANTWLAHPFTIYGEVIHGDKIGRTIGFPTANIQINDPYKLIPATGVYAVWVELNGEKFKGALSISKRPTVREDGDLRVEVYIIDFDRDIYGENLKLIFQNFIRSDIRFDNIQDMVKQIHKDIDKIKNLLK
ncbi:MAG: bifunctional riboflavin kinase/FAD synthetase [Chitinophagales bacterium]|nr:bifunctional riboflavin kinase/FAD synthetase [Chitinophagales bacterium]MCZ2394469.1 bifunctional riboflavin kinase/FAD synthetase [Chitinophagales bacterium]